MTDALALAQARIAELEAKLSAKKAGKITFKVSEKGAVSVYGLGRWPVTLYKSQWTALLQQGEALQGFMVENAEKLAEKE